jgi:hypothetical protein
LRLAISIFICFCFILSSLAYSSPSELANQDANVNPERNVITASDGGGGGITVADFVLVFLGVIAWMGLLTLILNIFHGSQ